MKKSLLTITGILAIILILIEFSSTAVAQDEIRKSLKASVTQRLGVDTDITIEYSRPGVIGRKVWGELVPFGMAPGNKYSNEKPYPWRAGANENTTISFNNDLLIEGKKIAAGKYGIHMIPTEQEWTVIFNKKNADWGSYAYDEKEDALRVKVKPVKAAHQEWLLYGFEALAGTTAKMYLHWETLKIPVTLATDAK